MIDLACLDEGELRELIEAVRVSRASNGRAIYEAMADADILMRLIRGEIDPMDLAGRVRCEKVLMWVVGPDCSQMVLDEVPHSRRSRGVCLAAVTDCGTTLKDVPEELRDREMCMAAVRQCGTALQYVPEDLKDLEMCRVAIEENVKAMSFVPSLVGHLLDF